MQINTRHRLSAGGRGLEFLAAHPDPSPSAREVAAELARLLGHSDQLRQAQRAAEITVTAMVNLKAELLRSIKDGLAALVGISRSIARDRPDMTVHLCMPRGRVAEVTLITAARVALQETMAERELFENYGMPETLPDDMGRLFDDYRSAAQRQRHALNAQVGATAQLAAVGLAVMRVLKHLDALHRLRFRDTPDLKAAWKSARKVAWSVGRGTRVEGRGSGAMTLDARLSTQS